jgi:hypothetical protein
MTGRGGEVAAALSAAAQCAVPAPDPQAQAFRELVIALAGGRPYGEVEPLLQALGESGSSGDVLWGWGRAALAAGNVQGAAEAARALAAGVGRARGHALAAEVAFARGDARAFEASVDALLALRVAAGERADRDRLAIEVASSAAVLQAGDPRAGRGAALARALDRIESALPLSRTPATARIREALRNASSAQRGRGKGPLPVALGVVAVSARPLPPPLPTLPIAWPEPRSLLAIPTAGGGTRDWFDAPVAAAGNPP